jgi:hypothetical protein
MTDTVLVEQPTKKPVRKLRIAGYVLAGLTVVTYVVGAIQGSEVVDEDAALQALGVLLSGLVPWLAAYLAKSEAGEA